MKREQKEKNSNKESPHILEPQFLWRERRFHVFRVSGACLIIESIAVPAAVEMPVAETEEESWGG